MIDLYLVHKILSLISVSLGLFLGFWVYSSERESKINKYFSIICFSFSLFWVHQFFTTSLLAKISLDYANWNLKLGYFGASVTALALFYFCLYFPKETKIPLQFKKLIICFCVFLCFISLSPFLVQEIHIDEESGVLEGAIYGWGRYFYFPLIIPIVLGSVWMVIRKYFFLNPEEKLKTQYFLLGFSLSATANMVGNVLYPLTVGIIHPIGNYSLIFFLGLTAYAIVKRQLFNIKVVMAEFLVWTMGFILFVLIFIVPVLWFKILLFAVFTSFCFIGHSLIKYMRREERQKRFLEEKVAKGIEELKIKVSDLESFVGWNQNIKQLLSEQDQED